MTKTAENRALWGHTDLYSPYKEVPPPPPGSPGLSKTTVELYIDVYRAGHYAENISDVLFLPLAFLDQHHADALPYHFV